MDIIYALAGLILMLFTCFITWINWRILRVSEDLLDISKILLEETILIRKGMNIRTPIIKIKDEVITGKRS